MISFLFISGISLLLLLAVYYLLLQHEKMHGFNRFYLLFAITFSLIIPFIEFETKQELIPFAGLYSFTETVLPTALPEQEMQSTPTTALWQQFALAIYIAGVLLMLARFLRHLLQFKKVIAKNPAVTWVNARLVLINKPVSPHSFLHYIFLSRDAYKNGEIEEELLHHELTHVRQRHSLDILFIESLMIFFWFHPLLYLYRKAIKLNHEFLADQSVLYRNNDVHVYQQILLNSLFMNKTTALASHVHYSLTKKRLIMMTKNTSLIRALTLKLAALPLFIGIAIILCVKTKAQQPPPPPEKKYSISTTVTNKDSLREQTTRYYSNKPGLVYTFRYKNGDTVTKGWKDMTQEERDHMPPPPPMPVLKVPAQQQLDEWLDGKKFGIRIDGRNIPNEQLRNYKPEDFGGYLMGKLDKDAKNYGKYDYQVMLTSREAFDADLKKYKKMSGME